MYKSAVGAHGDPEGVILYSRAIHADHAHQGANGGTSNHNYEVIDSAQHTSHRWPFFLPDGKHFLYMGDSPQPLQGGEQRGLLRLARWPRK